MKNVNNTSELKHRAATGAKNLLRNCVDVKPGDSLLLVEEEHGLGYFDAEVPRIIEREARALGATVLTMSTPRAEGPNDVPNALSAAMMHVDHTLFLNRIGDQMRFRSLPGKSTKTMVYTLDIETLAARNAILEHNLMCQLIGQFNTDMSTKKTWRIICPMGTDVSGEMPIPSGDTSDSSFSVQLFPMSVHRPIPAQSMNGRIVLQRWVTGTNTHIYDPEVFYFDSPVTVIIEQGHVIGHEGDKDVIAAFVAHSKMVAGKFGLDASLVHSWHCGLNPGTGYYRSAADNPVRWNGMIFGSPRHLHFHTCGDYPPGEINWHVLDPTVTFDEEVFVEKGHVRLYEKSSVAKLISDSGLPADAFQTHQNIGLQGGFAV